MANKHKHLVALNASEEQMFQDLIVRGYRKTEILRQGLRLLHRKEIPAYAALQKGVRVKSGDHELTPEEICIAEGGTIVLKDGVKYCQTTKGALEYHTPIV